MADREGCRGACLIARWILASVPLLFALAAAAQETKPASPAPAEPPPTVASVVDRQVSSVEKLVVEAAEAMPADKFDFTPASLKIPGSGYEGVRTFALQVRHIAASNYALWIPLTGFLTRLLSMRWLFVTAVSVFMFASAGCASSANGHNATTELETKGPWIPRFLKDSYALGHRAAASLTAENMLQAPEGSKSVRLQRATFGVAHAYDHYGQLVEYLRMNGIVPPASRGN